MKNVNWSKRRLIRQFFGLSLVAIVLIVAGASPALADEITDWNKNMFEAALAAGTSPLFMHRFAAIVQSAVFDAVNGIERRYTPIHVEPNARRGASRRAAAIQAAYATLVKIYPSQIEELDKKRAASLAAISSGRAAERGVSIRRGIEWGQTVADAIWAWRSTDGFMTSFPPFLGGAAAGQWRPTPPSELPGVGQQFAYMTPFVISSPSQFRVAGPPALTSNRYLADFTEARLMGNTTSVSRSADQTLYSKFWASSSPNYFWNQVAVSLAKERRLMFSEKARLLAFVNLAIGDAGIGCWDAKYFYAFWRPVTAIPLASTDGNPATIEDPSWTPLLVTPAFPEYPSGHACASSAAARVLSAYFGERTSFTVGTDNPTMSGVTRSFRSLSSAIDEINNSRIFGGIHFRSACNDGRTLGVAVANYVLNHALRRLRR